MMILSDSDSFMNETYTKNATGITIIIQHFI
jgi:hypothetical protein